MTANTLALELVGVTADTPNPQGGVIRREADGKKQNEPAVGPSPREDEGAEQQGQREDDQD